MGSLRVIQAIMGYIIPFALLVAFLFLLEVSLELGLALLFGIINTAAMEMRIYITLPAKPDFPGPLNLLNFAIGAFPSIWDIGTTLFWGTIEEFTFILFILFSVMAALTGHTAFTRMKDAFKGISDSAGTKSQTKSRMSSYDKITE